MSESDDSDNEQTFEEMLKDDHYREFVRGRLGSIINLEARVKTLEILAGLRMGSTATETETI